jgi:rhodanese-related sulfurtransferase
VNVEPDFRDVSTGEAAALVAAGATVIDVRTAEEYAQLGHIPGARLLPVDLIACAPALLDDPAAPVLVCCEHGVRSRHAADVLARAGFAQVAHLAGGMASWSGARERGAGRLWGPSEWLLEVADLLPRGGRVLDVACGRGRHALLLAGAGFDVHAVDRDAGALAWLSAVAERLGLPLTVAEQDVEAPGAALGDGLFDVLLVFNFLHRPLLPALAGALRPGGLLVYETFTVQHARYGRPSNPAFLLQPGELRGLCAGLGLELLRQREEDDGRRASAAVAARRQR